MTAKLLTLLRFPTPVLCLLISLCAFSGSAATEPLLSATVATDESRITAFSSLLVRASLENKSSEVYKLTQPVSELHGTARVLLRRPGSEAFVEVMGRYFGLKETLNYRSELKPGETMVGHILLLCDRDEKFVFDTVGTYQLRVAVGAPSSCVTSATVNIEVRDASPSLLTVAKEFKKDIAQLSLHEALPREQLLHIKNLLAPFSQFENTLRWVEAISLEDQHISRLQQLRTTARPLWKELAGAGLAKHLAERGRVIESKQLLTEITTRSKLTDDAKKIIDEANNR